MLCLYLQAPFGVFRTFTAGSFRPTAGFITPSAAYGLVLNVAGIDMRNETGKEMTEIRQGLPEFRLAMAALSFPFQHSLLQQLHNYPVGGSTGKDHAPKVKGSKYNIGPVRRSFLSDIKAYIAVEGDQPFENTVIANLNGGDSGRYGLPFLGDNNFLIDRLEPVRRMKAAYWYVPVLSQEEDPLKKGVTRLTTSIDRSDMSKTRSALFAPVSSPTEEIPEEAWVCVGY